MGFLVASSEHEARILMTSPKINFFLSFLFISSSLTEAVTAFSSRGHSSPVYPSKQFVIFEHKTLRIDISAPSKIRFRRSQNWEISGQLVP